MASWRLDPPTIVTSVSGTSRQLLRCSDLSEVRGRPEVTAQLSNGAIDPIGRQPGLPVLLFDYYDAATGLGGSMRRRASRYVPHGSLCSALAEQIFHVTASNGIVSNSPYTSLAIITASPIRFSYSKLPAMQMSSRGCARNAVGARSRDHRAERSSVPGICFWPFIVRQHAPIVHPLLARPCRSPRRPTARAV
jgi:hypothetical protein